MFYVYEWYREDTQEVFYVGKGSKKRYLYKKHNRLFQNFIRTYPCKSRIVKYFENENDAFLFEEEHIALLKTRSQAVCNIQRGGFGGSSSDWDEEKRAEYSKKNIMKRQEQRQRMIKNNPMKNEDVAIRVGLLHRRPIEINGEIYSCAGEAAEKFNINIHSIRDWCKKGGNRNGWVCRYLDEEQKQLQPRKYSSKAVVIDGIKYNSVKEGAISINCSQEALIRAMKQNRECKGHKCRYDNQQPSREKSDNSITEGSTTNR